MISIFIPMKRAKDKTEKWCVSVFQTLCLVSDQSWLCFFRFHSNLWFAAFSQSERCVPDIAPCSSSSVFPQHRVCIEQSTESAKCSDCSAAEPSQSIGGRTFCGWKDGNSRVSEHLPNVATRFQQQRWQPSLNSTDNEIWKTFVEKSEQGPLLGEMRQIKTDTWCNWPKESSEPKVGRRKVSQGGNWVKGVWMSLSEQSKGGGRIFAGTELGRIWRSGSLGICRWDPAWLVRLVQERNRWKKFGQVCLLFLFSCCQGRRV